ncbi:MAG: amidohydrolase [Bacteroidota bacterium]
MSSLNQDLRVSYVQTELVWENPIANCAQLEESIQNLQGLTDLIVLPEMFSTGFSMSEIGAEISEGPTVQWMKLQAARLQVLLIGSLKIKESGHYYNRLMAVHPSGHIDHYDKRHLFRMGEEDSFYTAGERPCLISYKSWSIAPFICYDLRFPVWSRNVNLGYDLAIYVANWPAVRINAWSSLLRARAIENLAYVVGVNRVGVDGSQLEYAGASSIISYKGEDLLPLTAEPSIQTYSLSFQALLDFREKFPAHLDADEFRLLT